MGTYTRIPESAFDALQLDAGVLLNSFNPASPSIVNSNIICATTGGITIACTPTYSDFGDDVDNCPNNLKEMKHLDGWECKITTKSLGTSVELIRLALGAADVTVASGKIVPRRDLSQNDFADLITALDQGVQKCVQQHTSVIIVGRIVIMLDENRERTALVKYCHVRCRS